MQVDLAGSDAWDFDDGDGALAPSSGSASSSGALASQLAVQHKALVAAKAELQVVHGGPAKKRVKLHLALRTCSICSCTSKDACIDFC